MSNNMYVGYPNGYGYQNSLIKCEFCGESYTCHTDNHQCKKEYVYSAVTVIVDKLYQKLPEWQRQERILNSFKALTTALYLS